MAERARGIVLAQTNAGDVIPSGTITVREPGTSTSISETIYVNDDPDASEYTNGAFFTGADGLIVFYLEEAKRVDVLITKSGYSSVTYPVDVSFTANRFLFRGAWSGATAYAVDDVVTLSGSTYIAIQAGTNQNPSTETAYWTLMAQKGADGGIAETLIDAAGDLIIGSADDTAARLAIGTAGQVLTVNAGATAPEWDDAATATTGDLLDWQFVRKTADESVTASTTLQNDDHLLLALGTSQTWQFEFVLNVNGPTAGDFKVDVNAPAGASGMAVGMGLAEASAGASGDLKWEVNSSFGTAGIVFGTSGSGNCAVIIKGIVITAGTAGNLQLRWAQNTSDLGATTLVTNSYLTARRVA